MQRFMSGFWARYMLQKIVGCTRSSRDIDLVVVMGRFRILFAQYTVCTQQQIFSAKLNTYSANSLGNIEF